MTSPRRSGGHAELLEAEPHFERPGPDGRAACADFRIGDYQHELGCRPLLAAAD
ncbi:MAG TPA: hypothetical protein VGQ26_00020 [Streptosporangiaceae bacterium]|nr:hypothetical protein [Streptosporangiaceae bacterium]